MVISGFHNIIIIALNLLVFIYYFSNTGNNNLDTNGKLNVVYKKYIIK